MAERGASLSRGYCLGSEVINEVREHNHRCSVSGRGGHVGTWFGLSSSRNVVRVHAMKPITDDERWLHALVMGCMLGLLSMMFHGCASTPKESPEMRELKEIHELIKDMRADATFESRKEPVTKREKRRRK